MIVLIAVQKNADSFQVRPIVTSMSVGIKLCSKSFWYLPMYIYSESITSFESGSEYIIYILVKYALNYILINGLFFYHEQNVVNYIDSCCNNINYYVEGMKNFKFNKK